MSVLSSVSMLLVFFFFQAEDGIRDYKVTGVQTCALPISARRGAPARGAPLYELAVVFVPWWYFAFVLAAITVCVVFRRRWQIGRASCRESVDLGGRRIIKKKKKRTSISDDYLV